MFTPCVRATSSTEICPCILEIGETMHPNVCSCSQLGLYETVTLFKSPQVVFTARLHVMQRTVLPKSFCPSVCQTRALRQNERNMCANSSTTWKIIHPSFLTRRMVGGGRPFYLKFWAKLTPLERKCWCSIDICS